MLDMNQRLVISRSDCLAILGCGLPDAEEDNSLVGIINEYGLDNSASLLAQPGLLSRPSDKMIAAVVELTPFQQASFRNNIRNVARRIQSLLTFHIPNH